MNKLRDQLKAEAILSPVN